VTERREIIDDIDLLLDIMPPRVRERLSNDTDRKGLVEVVLDLGRLPEARFNDHETTIGNQEVTRDDIEHVVHRVGEFGGDNRAGIERTLHRISGIRNRRGEVVGLTCRVGRAVFGTIDIILDLVDSGNSLLLLGKPGVGKTTLLRETARVLAEQKRVVIVDTSNEIAGDGDIPHPAIGRSRRMQVPTPELQHEIMIEAVENHTPQVIVIDEIGREEEAAAARTIAERGVQLVGTAHGNQIDNLMMNPTLSDLVGGIASVTLSDEEARRRGTQKSVLERKAPPTFDVVIEIRDRNTLMVHHDVGGAVDALLRGRELEGEVRQRTENGEIAIYRETVNAGEALQRASGRNNREDGRRDGREGRERSDRGERGERGDYRVERANPRTAGESREVRVGNERFITTGQAAARRALAESLGVFTPTNGTAEEKASDDPTKEPNRTVNLFPYGISQNRLKQAARTLGLPVRVVSEVSEANVLLTLRSYYRKRPQVVIDAERRGLPVHVLRANTQAQMEEALSAVFGLGVPPDPFEDALRETQDAIAEIRRGAATTIDLTPRDQFIRRQQHDLARAANLRSSSHGQEPQRRVRIYAVNSV
jgi:stage III sporulation protein SpoIIIAA